MILYISHIILFCSVCQVSDGCEATSVLDSIRGAGLTLEQVLSGERNGEISAALQAAGLDEDKWWRALLRVVQGELRSTGFGLWR